MATDFYQRQSDARRGTIRLVVMFCIAVVLIVGAVVAIASVVVQISWRSHSQSLASQTGSRDYLIPAMAGLVALVIIASGSLFKIWQLQRGGGTQVAESLGGRRLYPNTTDPIERRLLNVVEEMAIASGTPVPPVFLLDEDGINAFAAGYSPSDAVLGITRGCAENLSRDELQGVIAHEFSHILNGDMRMSIKLIGILYGILLIGLTGRLILRTFIYSGRGRSSSRSEKGGGGAQVILVMLAVAVAAILLGMIGTFFGNLIKAAVSRQREYLADASAVQFTRNPSGIAGALKRIGGASAGSQLQTANAAEASHMFFSQGVWEGITGLWATHPPLDKRIRAIEPNWNGKFLQGPAVSSSLDSELAAGLAGSSSLASATEEVPVAVVNDAFQQVGEPTTAHQHYAAEIIRQLPVAVRDWVREPYGARVVVYCLLLDKQPEIRKSQIDVLIRNSTPDIVPSVQKLQTSIDGLDIRARLPVVDLAIPALKAISASQYKEFMRCFVAIVKADERISLFEWMLSQVLTRHVRPQFEAIKTTPTRYYGLSRLGNECSALLSILASAGNAEDKAIQAFEAGARHLPELKLQRLPKAECKLSRLQSVLATLDLVSAKHRGRLVDACAAAICADGHVNWQEAELLRGISDLLDCPMPPLLIPHKR